MTTNGSISSRWLAAAAAAGVVAGAGTALLWSMRSMPAAVPSAASARVLTQSTGSPSSARAAAEISLTEDEIQRAGIELANAVTTTHRSSIRVPGTVEPNGYKQVAVTPIVGGRITRVFVELGAHVKQGQTLAQVFSPELADAQTKYVSAQAELDAHERELDRTVKLVDIGAASRQELERLHAEHTAKVAGVQSLRSRLELLGMSASTIAALSPGKEVEATTNIPAPIAGVITARDANVGLNVEASTKLFTVVDLSSVWITGSVFEGDFAQVGIGSETTVRTSAYPGMRVSGRVSYIDPQVDPNTRTARVRIEVANPREELRLGMFVDVETAGTSVRQMLTIPRGAVQTVGDEQVVYVADPDHRGRFTERVVKIGDASGETIEVTDGLRVGEKVVSHGSFFVRAAREQLR